MGPKVSN